MVSYSHIKDDFCKAESIHLHCNLLGIDHFYKLIENNKD